MKTIQRNGVTIDYRLTGNGPTTLLFVHGAFIDQTYWDEQVAFFSPDFTVVTLDLPGHGQSGRNRDTWSIEEFGEDVVAVLKGLDLQQVILIGHSLGGDVILEAAIAYPDPVVGFIAVDVFKNAATPLPEEYDEQVEIIKQNLITDFATTSEQYVHLALVTPETPAAVTDRVAQDYHDAYAPMGQPIITQVFDHYKRERFLLPQLPFKLYLIAVDYTPTFEQPLEQYLRKGYEVVHLQGTSHYPMLESPTQLNDALREVIDKIRAK